MSDKFLGSGQGSINLSNGSATIYSATLGAASLDPSRPVKTNSVKQLISANLDISEVNSLSTQLTEKDELTFVEDNTHTTPAAGKIKIYAKTDKKVYKLDDTGTETAIGGTTLQDAYINSGVNPGTAAIDIDNTRTALTLRNATGSDSNTMMYITNALGSISKFAVNGFGQVTSNGLTANSGDVGGAIIQCNGASGSNSLISSSRAVSTDAATHRYRSSNSNKFEVGLFENSENYNIFNHTTGQNVLSINPTSNDINLNDKISTNRTTFTDDQELITKKYVDDNSGGGTAITDANNNIFIAQNAGSSLTSGFDNILLGPNAGTNITTGGNNYALGVDTLAAITTEIGNIAIGNGAQENSTANNNTSLGHSTLKFNTTGTDNTAVGVSSLLNNTTGNYITCVGSNSGLSNTTQPYGTYIGYEAAKFPDGPFNTAVGANSQKGVSGNSTGGGNSSLGYNSLLGITTGINNTSVGISSGSTVTTGSNNVSVGSNAALGLTTGSNNTSVGWQCNFQANSQNSCTVGSGCTSTQDNEVVVGDANVTQIVNNGNGVCNLGSSSNQFKDLYLSGEIKTATPDPTTSTILSKIDFTSMYPASMRANILSGSGGTNKCWGHVQTYKAGSALLAGRVVSLKDQTAGTDNSKYLEVDYLIDSSETNATVVPIGVTQNNALIGAPVDVCVLGYTTAIAYNSDSTPERGAQIMSAPTSSQGKVYLNTTGGGNECRFGYVAQSDAVSANGTVLIYFRGYYQPY
tara:strand:+ start:11 stop:2257 length:2247 start_codon:yes stop_codon:yes gene_type:complete